MKRGASGRAQQATNATKKGKQAGRVVAATPRGVGDLDNYSIRWSMETTGRDHEHGGNDFKRIEVTGKLMFEEPDGESDKEEVGTIKATQYRLHYIGNTGADAFEIFDTTQEGMEVYNAVVGPLMDDFGEEMQGDALVIELIEITPAHRGHRLGLFMIEAADTVINGNMSACIIKPFPLQFEGGTNTHGFPAPPGQSDSESNNRPSRQEALEAAKAKLRAFYCRLGFHQHDRTAYMIRWNGYNHPSLDNAMA